MDLTKKNSSILVQNLRLISEKGLSFLEGWDHHFEKGKVYAIVGESGSGKTTFAFTLFGILPKNSKLEYKTFQILGRDWKQRNKSSWNEIRGKSIALIPQNPHVAFHPYRKVGPQVMDFLRKKVSPSFRVEDLLSSWKELGIANPERAFHLYPIHLSGGEKQRVSISLANLCQAEWVVADEPTSALDPIQERAVVGLLVSSQKQGNQGLILISHNLHMVSQVADEVLVIQSGKIVEKCSKGNGNAFHWKTEYAKKLWNS